MRLRPDDDRLEDYLENQRNHFWYSIVSYPTVMPIDGRPTLPKAIGRGQYKLVYNFAVVKAVFTVNQTIPSSLSDVQIRSGIIFMDNQPLE